MNRKGWYMIAYDISDPKRLQRVHRKLKKKAIAVQKSVFFANGTEDEINCLMDTVSMCMKNSADDLRAYPIVHPKYKWHESHCIWGKHVLFFQEHQKKYEKNG
jgi:CRISPR-associated endonuclease Cas2